MGLRFEDAADAVCHELTSKKDNQMMQLFFLFLQVALKARKKRGGERYH